MTLEIITDPKAPCQAGDVVLSPETLQIVQHAGHIAGLSFDPLYVQMGRSHAWELKQYFDEWHGGEANAQLLSILLAAAVEPLPKSAQASHALGVSLLLDELL